MKIISSCYIPAIIYYCISLFLNGCSPQSNIPIQYSSIQSYHLGSRFYWVSDDEVLFTAKTNESKSTSNNNLYLWNIQSNTYKTLAQGVDYYCLSQEQVVFKRTHNRNLFAATLHSGMLTDIKEEVGRLYIKDFLTCESGPLNIKSTDHRNSYPIKIQLQKKHGVLELPSAWDHGLAFLYVPTQPEPKPVLGLNSENTAGANQWIQYLPYLDAYLLTGNDTGHIRLLKPSGEVITIPAPKGPWRKNYNKIYLPVKDGFLVDDLEVGLEIMGPAKVTPRGLYLAKHEKTTANLLPRNHVISQKAVSPNGCRVIFNIADYGSNRYEIKRIGSINTCEVH